MTLYIHITIPLDSNFILFIIIVQVITKLPAFFPFLRQKISSNIDVEMKLIEKRVEVSWQDNVIEANDKSKSDV